jgi:hypothetical protein
MDGHRPIELNDSSLDREIASMLAAEPSAEFVARVRARVAQEPEPAGWRASWMFAAATAVAAAIVVLIAWPSREPMSINAPVPSPRVAEAVETVTPPSTPAAPQAVSRPARARAVAVVAAGERAIDIDLPEIVIAENEARTYAALVTSVRQSRFDVAVPAAPNPDTPLEIKELPPVEPLEIEPIVRVAALQAEGERP